MSKLGKLSDVEMEIMQAIWGLSAQDAHTNGGQSGHPSPVTISQLLAIFEDSKGWKHPTVSTLLDRIITKGFLRKEVKGRTNYYCITATLADYQRQEGRNIISSLYGGSVKNFMAALVEDGGMNKAEVKELRDWFANNVDEDGDIK